MTTDKGRAPDYGSVKLRDTQREVDQVVGIMRTNIDKIIIRDERISSLEDKSDALRDGAIRFEANAKRVKTQMVWKNRKTCLVLTAIVIIIIGIIVLVTKPWA